jgi:hypothetical protein
MEEIRKFVAVVKVHEYQKANQAQLDEVITMIND